MVPTGFHRRSQEDWHSTVGAPVQFSKYGQLTPDQLRWLRYAFPSGRACIWATSKYNDWPQPRDHVWFHQDNYVIGIGEVHASFENPDLAGALWQEGIETWQKGLPETPKGDSRVRSVKGHDLAAGMLQHPMEGVRVAPISPYLT